VVFYPPFHVLGGAYVKRLVPAFSNIDKPIIIHLGYPCQFVAILAISVALAYNCR
jgi:hypothetical protein